MKSKINFAILLLLCLPILTLAQSSSLQGKWSFLTLKETGETITLPELSQDHYLNFSKNNVFSSSITCNSIGGKYLSGTNGKIKFKSLRITLMACSDDKLKVEQNFSRVLEKVTKYQIKDNILTLQDEKGTNVVTLTKYKELKENI